MPTGDGFVGDLRQWRPSGAPRRVHVTGRDPLSVLHVAEPTDYGVARCVADLVHDQIERGWRVNVLAPPGGDLEHAIAPTGAGHLLWGSRRTPQSIPRDLRSVGRAVATTAPDVV